MIIHTPEITVDRGETCISARFELRTPSVEVPEHLWFRLPEKHGKVTSGRADGFAASLLLLAMRYGEDLEVRGALSPRLAFGMEEYQRVLHSWAPELQIINVTCAGYESPSLSDCRGKVATAFSGGVDSFYTLWSHLPVREPNPAYRLSHALFLHGYDIPLAEEWTFRMTSDNYSQLMQELGLDLVTVRTNIYDIVTPTVGWLWAHGSALIGAALLLDRLCARFYVPSSHTYADALPWGSDPRIDHLLSTEALQIIHDGAAVSRTQKTASIASWPATYTRLRVCWEKMDGLNNCCRCSKCIRTMVALDAMGMLSRYTTFPLPFTRRSIRECLFEDENERGFAQEAMNFAGTYGRNDVVFDLRYALLRSRLMPWANLVRRAPRGALRRLSRGRNVAWRMARSGSLGTAPGNPLTQ